MWNFSRRATSLRFPSTLPAGAAEIALKARPACAHGESRAAGRGYGYVDMGGWVGGQADYVMVPYADFNLLQVPRQRSGDGEDQGLDTAQRYFPPATTARFRPV